MENPLVRKLSHGAPLTEDDAERLTAACALARRVPARTPLIREGDDPTHVHLVLEGFACRYKLLPDGERQLIAYFVPGDLCDLHVQILRRMDHGIATLVDSVVVDLAPEIIAELTANPRINRALWWATLVDEAILREWLVSMGQRSTDQQMAHLFCEIIARMKAIGRAEDDCFDMPFTQEELADTLGVTTVHANRVLTQLRADDLVRTEGRRLIVPNLARLKAYCHFDPAYLHLDADQTASNWPSNAPPAL